MARSISSRMGAEREVPLALMLDNFKGGRVTLLDQTVTPPTAMVESKNMMQVQDGRWAVRWGTQYYGSDLGGQIEGIERYVAADKTSHLVAVVKGVSNSTIKRSTDNGATWTSCTGATRTSGKQSYFVQSSGYLYIANSTDDVIRYDGTTTLQTFTTLAAPASPAGTVSSGLTGTNSNLYYQVTAINEVGETLGSTEVHVTTSKSRNNWKNDPTAPDAQYVDVTWTAVSGASRYNIYLGDHSGGGLYLDSTTDLLYHDTGKASLSTFIVVPTQNTTLGPKFGPMELSGNRIWGTQDKNNPWRVWYSGTFPHMGAFNPYYDGGYIDLDLGGAERPVKVVHYRDGKGGSFATVLTADPEGNGSIWQIDLQTITAGNYSYTLPVPTKIVGSTGTIAPLSVVKVKNDIMFFNRKGIFTLGSKAQMLNLLTTDEISANIRPDIRGLSGTALGGVAGIYYDAKVFYSVPSGSTSNNVIFVNDTERRNWSGPWTVGVSQFLVYSDSSGANHLLGVPSTGSRLIEFKEGVAGDLGQPFETLLITGLIPVNPRDRTAFAKVDRVYIELSHPVGNLQFSILGNDRRGRYSTGAAVTLTGPLGDAGYATQAFDTFMFSDTSKTAISQSEPIIHKFLKVRKKLNNVQFKIQTFDLGVNYTLLSLQAKGFMIDSRDPARWKA